MKEELVYLGVDIAKSHLDAAIGNQKRRFANERIGHRELIKWVKQHKVPVQVVCESSGGYERALVQALVGAQLKVSLVQANRVRQFARAAGILAKTDRIDAKLLRDFAEALSPECCNDTLPWLISVSLDLEPHVSLNATWITLLLVWCAIANHASDITGRHQRCGIRPLRSG